MSSYELQSFEKFNDVTIVGALEEKSTCLNVGFWLRDHLQIVQYPESLDTHAQQDFLWQDTCFEIFIGVKNQDFYREINLSPSNAWQCYSFEEYRYPEQIPPVQATDIQLIELKRTHYGLNATIDLADFLMRHQLKWTDLFIGLSVVLNTKKGFRHFALQHSSPILDFHNKRDWLHTF